MLLQTYVRPRGGAGVGGGETGAAQGIECPLKKSSQLSALAFVFLQNFSFLC